MAWTKAGPGRPYPMADMPFRLAGSGSIRDEFHDVCRSLNYHDIVAISRALRVTERTVEKWKYQERFPKQYEIALDIVDWVNRGKPVVMMLPPQSIAGMP